MSSPSLARSPGRAAGGRGGRSGWKLLLGFAVSILLVVWVLRDVDPREVWYEVRRADPLLLAVGVFFATSGFLIRALRWRFFLDPIRPGIRLGSRWAAVNIGFGLNNVLPWRMGEFARVWALSRLERIPIGATLGSLVVERVMDGIVVVALLAAAVLHWTFPADATVGGEPIGALLPGVSWVLLLGAIALVAALVFPGAVVSGIRAAATRLRGERGHAAADAARSFLDGLQALREPRRFVASALWTLGFWMWNALGYLFGMWAFGVEEGYVAALFVQSVVTLGVAIPAAPGYVGTFQAAAMIALHEVYGAPEGNALAFAFGFHLAGFIPVTVLGLWYANRVGLTLAGLKEAEGGGEEGA